MLPRAAPRSCRPATEPSCNARRLYSHEKRNFRRDHQADHKHEGRTTPQIGKEKDTVLQFSVHPLSSKEPSMSKYVGICARMASQSGMKFQVGPMGTSVEGSLDDTLELVRKAVDACMREPSLESQRMLLNIQADVRPGSNANRLSNKMATIQAVLSRVPDADKQ